jgi:hypothetical protein
VKLWGKGKPCSPSPSASLNYAFPMKATDT